jgi:hypothetical protein
MASPHDLLQSWLTRRLTDQGREWLGATLAKVAQPGDDKALYVALGLVPRKLGKADLTLGSDELEAAAAARRCWDPRGWSVDQAARVLLLLGAAEVEPDRFPDLLDTLCATADVGELVAIYRGLPLYPRPDSLVTRAGEGARSNMRALFEAVAHRNPFPREQFAEPAWNHMVLKALFIGSTLYPIQGLDVRANRNLACMLRDFAHERWSAGRPVSPELWRCVAPYAEGEALDDLAKALEMDEAGGAPGAALALAANGGAGACEVLARAPELAAAIESGRLSWETLSKETG